MTPSDNASPTPPFDPSLDLPLLSRRDWIAVLGCVGYAGAVSAALSDEDSGHIHQGVLEARRATLALQTALGDDLFNSLLNDIQELENDDDLAALEDKDDEDLADQTGN